MQVPARLKSKDQLLELNTICNYPESPFDRTPITEVTYLKDNYQNMCDFFGKTLIEFEKKHSDLKDDSSEKVVVTKIRKFLQFPTTKEVEAILEACKAKAIKINEIDALRTKAGIKIDAKAQEAVAVKTDNKLQNPVRKDVHDKDKKDIGKSVAVSVKPADNIPKKPAPQPSFTFSGGRIGKLTFIGQASSAFAMTANSTATIDDATVVDTTHMTKDQQLKAALDAINNFKFS